MENKAERERYTIPLSEPVTDIVVGALLAALMIISPQIFRLCFFNECITLFNVDVARGIWFVFAGEFVLTALKGGVKIADRRYTMGLAFMTLVTNALSLALTAYALLMAGLLNPAFFSALSDLIGRVPVLTWILGHMPLFITVCTAFGMVVDVIATFAKAAARAVYEAEQN